MQMGFFLMWRGRVYNDCMIFLFSPNRHVYPEKRRAVEFLVGGWRACFIERSWRWGIRRMVMSMIQQRLMMELSSGQMMGTTVDFLWLPDDFGPVVVQQIRPSWLVILCLFFFSFLLFSFLHHHTQTFVSTQITHIFPILSHYHINDEIRRIAK